MWLQEQLCGDPCLRESDPRWFDVFFTTVYASHFLTGLTIAAVLWVRKREEWLRWMRRYMAINFGALVCYIVYPMAPPWMASEEGYIHEAIPRLTGRGWRDLGLGRFDLVLQGVGNPVAAMPSLHAGITFLVAMYGIWRLRTPLRYLLVLYPLAMSFHARLLRRALRRRRARRRRARRAGDGRRAGCGSVGGRDSAPSTTSPADCASSCRTTERSPRSVSR